MGTGTPGGDRMNEYYDQQLKRMLATDEIPQEVQDNLLSARLMVDRAGGGPPFSAKELAFIILTAGKGDRKLTKAKQPQDSAPKSSPAPSSVPPLPTPAKG